jgi:Tfp pilus assembly major pilin PilA
MRTLLPMVLPSHDGSGDVLWVFIVTAIIAVILAGVALVMYRRYKK